MASQQPPQQPKQRGRSVEDLLSDGVAPQQRRVRHSSGPQKFASIAKITSSCKASQQIKTVQAVVHHDCSHLDRQHSPPPPQYNNNQHNRQKQSQQQQHCIHQCNLVHNHKQPQPELLPKVMNRKPPPPKPPKRVDSIRSSPSHSGPSSHRSSMEEVTKEGKSPLHTPSIARSTLNGDKLTPSTSRKTSSRSNSESSMDSFFHRKHVCRLAHLDSKDISSSEKLTPIDLPDDSVPPYDLSFQEMVSIESFIEFVRKRDLGRIKFAIRETNFDIDSQDEDGKTAVHHAIMHGELGIAQHLIDYGCDVNIKDESSERESPIHVALRLGQLEAIKMILETPSFDVILCDALQRSRMLPEMALVDDIYTKLPADSDATLTKRRSFGDQFILFVRQNTREYMENNFPPGRESIRDMVIIQDDNVPPLAEMSQQIDLSQLCSLYIVHSKLHMYDLEILSDLNLTTLVLSYTNLKQLPRILFQCDCLEIFKVDHNNLAEIPAEVGMLRSLRTFCCDSQNPQLRALPHSITKLENLEVLSFSNNRIDNISWITALPKLKVLKCDRNRITRLPTQLSQMRELMVLDVSHNRLEYIPGSMAELIRRLYRFDYYNVTLRPRSVRSDKSQLLSHLEVENFLSSQSQSTRTVRDITVAVVGESHSGKSTLVEALKSERGICKQDMKQDSTFDIQQFEMHSNDDSCFVSTIVMANDVLDNFSKNIKVDLYLLVVDLTSLELQNGSQHLFARHVNRMQMWLQALYEVSPEVPVLIVGTHAELVKSMSFSDIWHIVENFLDQGRAHHIKHYYESRLSSCLLCNAKGAATRHVLAKSRSGSAGFVDLSFPHADGMMNGHVCTGESPPPGRLRFPHVVGYYEVDTKRNLPKDAKKNNVSIDQLKGAIMRLTIGSPDEGIPAGWLSFIRHIGTINEQAPNLPCIPYDEIISIARSFEIPPAQVPYMLHYFHARGKLVYFGCDEILSKLVVISPTWFITVLNKTMEGMETSQITLSDLIESTENKDLDRQLQKAGVVSISSAHWLIAALQRLDICVPYVDSDRGDKVMLFPNLLELGHISPDIWPELPEWDEKQVTMECSIRTLKPCLFTDLILRLNNEGRKLLDLVSDPAPVFLSHHMVFFTGLDIGGCEDCYDIRETMRKNRNCGGRDEFVLDDILHKVHIHLYPRMDHMRVTVRGVSPCCIIKAIMEFVDLYLDDVPEDECYRYADTHSTHSIASMSDEFSTDRSHFLLCPKCILLRQAYPQRIGLDSISSKRKAICTKWHNLGSWTRALTGEYRMQDQTPVGMMENLPEREHPRLVMVLPPSSSVSNKEWYLFCRMKFLEGFEVHFLCEYTGYWHLTDEPGYRLNQSPHFTGKVGNQLPRLLNMALTMVQIVNGCHEHGENGRMLTPVIADLIKMYDYLRNVDTHIQDPHAWLTKNKDRVVNMLTKVLANANDGFPDLYFKVGNPVHADHVFHTSSQCSRNDLAKFLRVENTSGRFGSLRPLYVGKEVRWLCDAHYEELRNMPSN